MVNKPGLLRRGLKCENEGKYEFLEDIVGKITPNCSEDHYSHSHTKECFQMEADIFCLYPEKDILVVIIVEVKRAQNGEDVKSSLVIGAFKQLVRDVRFFLSLLPDVQIESLVIRTFAAFPDSRTKDMFCDDCSRYILSKDDFILGSKHIKERLSIDSPLLSLQNEDLFKKCCVRLIGGESEEFPVKEINKYIMNYEKVVECFICMDEHQQNFLNTFNKNTRIRNLALKGPFGSGKTTIAIRCCNMLIDEYLNQGIKRVFVYAITLDKDFYNDVRMNLSQTFEEDISQNDDDRIIRIVKTFTQMKKDLKLRESGLKMEVIQTICDLVKKNHAGRYGNRILGTRPTFPILILNE